MAEPTQITVKGAPEGYNCTLSVVGYGARAVRVNDINHGVDIEVAQDETRDDATFYTLNVTEAPFAITCIFKTYGEREAMSKWLRGWAEAVSANQSVGGFITVRCPARRFIRTAVWEGGVVYGDAVGTVSYPMTLVFRAAEDPTSAVGQGDVFGDSRFQAASRDTAAAPYFYPAYYANGASGDAPDSAAYDRNKAAEDAKTLRSIGSTLGSALAPIGDVLGDLFGGD